MASDVPLRPALLLPLRDHRAFLDHYFHQGGLGGVFVPGEARLRVSEQVDLQVVFAKERVTIHARGTIRWRRAKGSKSLPTGVGVEFLPSERRARDLLLDFARGRKVALVRRRSRRYPAMLEIEYAHQSVFLSDLTGDLSREGAFIHSEQDISIGSRVALRLKVPGETQTLELLGEVRWHAEEGPAGFGVRFVFGRPEEQEALAKLVERIKTQTASLIGVPENNEDDSKNSEH